MDTKTPFGYNQLGFDDPAIVGDELRPIPATIEVGASLSATSNIADSATSGTLAETPPLGSLIAPPPHQQPKAHASHSLRRTGHIVWCFRCGRHAAVRLGSGFLQKCRDVLEGAFPAPIR